MNAKTSKAPGVGEASPAAPARKSDNGSWLKGLVTLIVVLIIIGGGLYLVASYTGIGSGLIGGGVNLSADWQAIFLSNGQVYFGKITKMNNDTIILRDIYYLQVVTQPLQRSAEGEPEQQPEQRLTLIKLGNEIHGPRDEMFINRSHVIIMEDLKNDSRVVQAINDYTDQAVQ